MVVKCFLILYFFEIIVVNSDLIYGLIIWLYQILFYEEILYIGFVFLMENFWLVNYIFFYGCEEFFGCVVYIFYVLKWEMIIVFSKVFLVVVISMSDLVNI